MAGVERDHEDERKPAKDGEEEDEDELSAYLALDLDVILGCAAGEVWRVRELPSVVYLAVRLLEETAISLKDGASFGLWVLRHGAIFAGEEGLEHLASEWEGWALLLEDIHVVIGHGHAASNLNISA